MIPRFWGGFFGFRYWLEGSQWWLYHRETQEPQLITIRVNYGHNCRWKQPYAKPKRSRKKNQRWRRAKEVDRKLKWLAIHQDFLSQHTTYRKFSFRSLSRHRSAMDKDRNICIIK